MYTGLISLTVTVQGLERRVVCTVSILSTSTLLIFISGHIQPLHNSLMSHFSI